MALPIIPRGADPSTLRDKFLKFVCPPTSSGGPVDPQRPTRLVTRSLDTKYSIPLPPSAAAVTRAGKSDVVAWIIENPSAGPTEQRRSFPSPIIRTVQGDVVWADVSASVNTHTIHWHGIEPTPMNDGVGHTSFEISSSFVYQFATSEPGTYFYHCHKNTVLHFEMGLYGALIVDPLNPGTRPDITSAPYPTGGPGFLAAYAPQIPGFVPGANVVPYDVEVLWVPDEFDSIWHDTLGHDAYMQHCDSNNPNARQNFTQDGILNNFIPDIFCISGVFPPVVRGSLNNLPIVTAPILTPPVAATIQVGQTLLVRLTCAAYTTMEITIGRPRSGLDALVVAIDGHGLGIPGTRNQYSAPFVIPAGVPFRMTPARRIDMLFRPTARGKHPVKILHLDWVKSRSATQPRARLVWGVTQTVINVI